MSFSVYQILARLFAPVPGVCSTGMRYALTAISVLIASSAIAQPAADKDFGDWNILMNVELTCSRYTPLNDATFQKSKDKLLDRLVGKYGQGELMAAIEPQVEKTKAEIKAAGPSAWCSNRKADLSRRGFSAIFKRRA